MNLATLADLFLDCISSSQKAFSDETDLILNFSVFKDNFLQAVEHPARELCSARTHVTVCFHFVSITIYSLAQFIVFPSDG